MKKVNILGTEYTIEYRELNQECIDGFCDYTEKSVGRKACK